MDLDQVRVKLADVGVGTVVYVLQLAGLQRCFMPIGPITPGANRFIGVARTLRTEPMREDVLALRRSQPKASDPHRIAIDEISAGEVLVVAARGDHGSAVLGDLLAQRIATLGGAGVVTDGCVRDLPGIRAVGLPVFAAGAHAATFPVRHVAIEVNTPVGCGGVLIYPGDLLIGDDEGVAVVPAERVDEIVEACLRQEEQDQFSLEKIREGVPLAEAYPLSAALRAEFERRPR
nr:hypothetical protein [Micromonospora sp. DSM 115978]